MGAQDEVRVELLDAADARDARFVEWLTGLVNDVYTTAERGLWREGARRTTTAEVRSLIAGGEIAVAIRGGRILGSMRFHLVADDASEFGMLVAAPEQRGTGVGRALVDFAERRSRELGLRAVGLELLLPLGWRHPVKEFLRAWYGRRGYRFVRAGAMRDAYPELAPLLATPCDLAVYEKPLATTPARSPSRAP